MAFWAIIKGLGILFHILLGFRWVHCLRGGIAKPTHTNSPSYESSDPTEIAAVQRGPRMGGNLPGLGFKMWG